ncbi:MAG: hypothetical protein ACFCU9_00260 [Cyanophyceae cyanobacterium]
MQVKTAGAVISRFTTLKSSIPSVLCLVSHVGSIGWAGIKGSYSFFHDHEVGQLPEIA